MPPRAERARGGFGAAFPARWRRIRGKRGEKGVCLLLFASTTRGDAGCCSSPPATRLPLLAAGDTAAASPHRAAAPPHRAPAARTARRLRLLLPDGYAESRTQLLPDGYAESRTQLQLLPDAGLLRYVSFLLYSVSFLLCLSPLLCFLFLIFPLFPFLKPEIYD